MKMRYNQAGVKPNSIHFYFGQCVTLRFFWHIAHNPLVSKLLASLSRSSALIGPARRARVFNPRASVSASGYASPSDLDVLRQISNYLWISEKIKRANLCVMWMVLPSKNVPWSILAERDSQKSRVIVFPLCFWHFALKLRVRLLQCE